jgi:FkbM family methyltransferase
MPLRLWLTHVAFRALEGRTFRGKGRLLDRLCPASGVATRTIFGRSVSLDLAEHIQRWMYLGLYETGPTRLVARYLAPGMTVVDVGANVGYYSLLALSLVGEGGRVLAFEPAERPRARLRSILGDVPNVVILDRALGARTETATLYVDRELDNDTPTMVASEGGVPVEVSVIRLDDCAAELGVERIDLLKLDVEGWEPHVLDGASGLLSRGEIGALLCELNEFWLHRTGTSAERLYQRILGLGFVDTTPDLPLGTFETRLFIHRSRWAS